MDGIGTKNGVVGQEARYKIRLLDRLDEAFRFGFGFLADDGLPAISEIVEVLATNVDTGRSTEISEVEIDLQKTAK